MTPIESSMTLFLQIAIVLTAGRLVGGAARRFGQPQVVGEMIAGVLLGPSLFGLLAPAWQQAVFPAASMNVLFTVSQIGLAAYMFLVGIEFRTELLRSHARGAIVVSVAGMATPFALGAALAGTLVREGGWFDPATSSRVAALFLGAAMSITAFPMLARIIYERGLSGSALGTLCLAAGALDDASAWCVLAVVVASFRGDWWAAARPIGGALLYAAVVAIVVRPLAARIEATVRAKGDLPSSLFTAIMVALMLAAWYTDRIGIYAVFGAFLLGAAVPQGALASHLRNRLEPIVVTVLLPLFFAYSGLNTRLDLLDSRQAWIWTAILLAVAVVGKGAACGCAAIATGADRRTAFATGALMNARGLMELIALNIGLEQGVITRKLFSVMVVMAIVTTLMATPLFELGYGRWARSRGLLGGTP
ncbi:MAG: cation:proton antiporter [Planctomycetes bacterium]|nr:cation:proton antiporter [Planctomycetota bacterium]